MEQTKTTISNNDFISLFISTMQIQFLREKNKENALTAAAFFSEQELKDFIYYSKRDPKYSDLLRCFNFTSTQNESYCIELSTAINYARAKKLITVTVGDLNYLSRFYFSNSPMEMDWGFHQLMEGFLFDFNRYRNAPADYIRELENQMSDFHAIQNGASDSFCFTLQRKLREQQIEDKDKK